jgi:hypothetical protein
MYDEENETRRRGWSAARIVRLTHVISERIGGAERALAIALGIMVTSSSFFEPKLW